MISVLEVLYVLTVLSFVASGVQFLRKRSPSARRFVWLGALGAGLSVLLYWLLRPPS